MARILTSNNRREVLASTGMTLIEILVVIAIIGLIALVAAPLTGTWVREANLLSAEGQLTQATGRARAASLRNSMAATGDNPVAILCVDSDRLLTLREGTTAQAPGCADIPAGSSAGGNQVWQIQLEPNVTFNSSNGNSFQCLCFSNKGLITTEGNRCSSCAANTDFTLSAGIKTENVSIY